MHFLGISYLNFSTAYSKAIFLCRDASRPPIDSFPVLEMFMIPQLWRERKKQRQRENETEGLPRDAAGEFFIA